MYAFTCICILNEDGKEWPRERDLAHFSDGMEPVVYTMRGIKEARHYQMAVTAIACLSLC